MLLWSAQALANPDVIRERAWYEDRTGSLTLEQVQSQPFTPYEGVLSRGYGPSTFWVRLLIAGRHDDSGPHQELDRRLVLRVAPVQLDLIELFDPLDYSADRRVTGDYTSWSSQEYPSLIFAFEIPYAAQDRYVWLRVHTTSSRLLHVEAVTLRQQHRKEFVTEILTAGFLGVLVFFVAWALNTFFLAPERLLALFAIKQIGAVVCSLFVLGYARLLLDGVWSPQTIELMSKFSILIYGFLAAIYQREFLMELKPPEWTFWIFRALLLTFSVAFVLLVLGNHKQAMMVNGLIILSVITGSMLMTYLGRYKSFKEDPESAMLPKPILLVLHGVLMASVALSVFPFMGFVRASIYLLYAPIVHAIISGSILVYVLQVRAHRKTIVNEQIKGKYTVLTEKLLLEQEFRQEQQNLLEMLAHEIKTPLAVIRLLVRRKSTSENVLARVDQAASEMRTIVDRCVQAARTTDKEHPFQKTQLDPLAVLRDVAHTHVSPNRIEILCDHGFSVEADEQLVRMALSNLLENACKYGNAALPVTVTLQQTQENGRDGVSFMVANAPGSAGWPDADRLFSKYYRSPHAHRQTGSGLGLYLVTIFSKQCGGFVRYCPTEEHVRFEFWIPFSND